MRPAPFRPAAAPTNPAAQPQRHLTNDEAADYLRLSPPTLEKQRMLGGSPKFRKFGRRVMHAVADLDAWAAERSFDSTSDPEYAEQHSADSLTSGWHMLSCSSSHGRNSSAVCGCEGFGAIGLLRVICKKTGNGQTIPCKYRDHQSAEPPIGSTTCELFRAD